MLFDERQRLCGLYLVVQVTVVLGLLRFYVLVHGFGVNGFPEVLEPVLGVFELQGFVVFYRRMTLEVLLERVL